MRPFRAWVVVVLSGVATSGVAVADPMPIEVRASGSCPSSEAVTAELGRIAAAPEEATSVRGRFDILESSRGVRVRLGNAPGGADGERAIETSADCAERAIAAAVVIASWRTDLRSKVRLDLEASTPSWFPSTGVAGLGVASGIATWAWGAGLDLQMAHRSGWGGRLAAWGTSYRTQVLGTSPGRARWTRWVLGIGPVYELARDRWLLIAAAQVAVGRFAVRGEDLASTRQEAAVDVGARLGIEVGFRLGAFVPCAGVAAVGWPRSHRVKALGVEDERTLPKLDVLLAAGFRWGHGP
ncbi:MAG: hypothetical protein JXP73_12950 [Deltaproteobacteria bacterium]|jgi:hypothetical protein|nr:hypothetical protein [Deltaproteobacteria bacterium]